jgi:hypothetical protein
MIVRFRCGGGTFESLSANGIVAQDADRYSDIDSRVWRISLSTDAKPENPAAAHAVWGI